MLYTYILSTVLDRIIILLFNDRDGGLRNKFTVKYVRNDFEIKFIDDKNKLKY